MQGFFAKSLIHSTREASTIPLCGSCGLYKTCLSPKMKVSGDGEKQILVVGEAPGKNEDEQGEQLIGKAGQHLRDHLHKLHIDLDRDCWKTNALICRPPSNATPTPNQIGYCRPNLINTVNELKPRTIILLGGSALSSCVSWIWKEQVGPISKWVGWNIPSQKLNAWICPTYHPSYLVRTKDPILEKLFRKHLRAACAHKKRPWVNILNYPSQVQIVLDPKKAARIIDDITAAGQLTAFDYECDRLKPEPEGSRIVCASICEGGTRTISFPWMDEAIEASIRYLKSRTPKIASNMKYEHRWTLQKLGFRVKRWVWDTMLAAHVLDNRPGITGLKFQAFIKLGVDSYNDHIEGLLKGKTPNKPNQIREIDLEELLQYNGMDSLLEYHVALKQMEEMGIDPNNFLEV